MLVAEQKHKHVDKTLREKAQALNVIEKGLLNKEVAEKIIMYQKIPYLHGSKIKAKSSSLEERQNVRRRKLRGGAHEVLEQAVFKWFSNTPFSYKQSIFDPRPKNCLSFSKKSPQKIV